MLCQARKAGPLALIASHITQIRSNAPECRTTTRGDPHGTHRMAGTHVPRHGSHGDQPGRRRRGALVPVALQGDHAAHRARPGVRLDHRAHLPHGLRHLPAWRLRQAACAGHRHAGGAGGRCDGRARHALRARRALRRGGGLFGQLSLPLDSGLHRDADAAAAGRAAAVEPGRAALKAITGVLFLLYLVGVGLQVRRLRGGGVPLSPAPVRASS
jgi:hypothetical protein